VAAINQGLLMATGDIVVMLDDDIVVHPGWLARIIAHFDDDRVAAVGGRDIVYAADGPSTLPRTATAGMPTWYGRYTGQHDQVEGPPRDVDVLKGCNWAIRRAAVGTLRFDDRLLGIGAQHGEDYWFNLNLRNAGWRVVLDPSAQVDHFPGFKVEAELGALSRKKCYEWTANQVAHNLAFASPGKRALYLLHSIFIGVRNCPGLYFILHTLAKRPRDLPGVCAGGWAGFVKGWGMAREFGKSPPGFPNPPPR
jgi:GT2 family glycosyltransferase